MRVTDKDSKKFELSEATWRHITRWHPEYKEVEQIAEVLRDPDLIARQLGGSRSAILQEVRSSLSRRRRPDGGAPNQDRPHR